MNTIMVGLTVLLLLSAVILTELSFYLGSLKTREEGVTVTYRPAYRDLTLRERLRVVLTPGLSMQIEQAYNHIKAEWSITGEANLFVALGCSFEEVKRTLIYDTTLEVMRKHGSIFSNLKSYRLPPVKQKTPHPHLWE